MYYTSVSSDAILITGTQVLFVAVELYKYPCWYNTEYKYLTLYKYPCLYKYLDDSFSVFTLHSCRASWLSEANRSVLVKCATWCSTQRNSSRCIYKVNGTPRSSYRLAATQTNCQKNWLIQVRKFHQLTV